MRKPSGEKSRILRFGIVGAVGTVVDFGIFNILLHFTTIQPIIASAISFSCAVVNNFILNRIWTFPDARQKTIIKQLVQFGFVSVIGLIIRTPIFAFSEKLYTSLTHQWLPDFFITPYDLSHNLALATAIVIVMVWNFIANRYWTFNEIK